MPLTTQEHPPALEIERPRFAAPRALYRYVPAPPVGLDDEGYLCDDEMSQSPAHADAMNHAFNALKGRFGPQAAVHMDLCMPYAEGDRSALICPDVMVSLGRGEPATGNWKLWERPVPDFVLELLSPSNWRRDVGEKKDTYEFLGVAECWLFDGGAGWLDDPLQGYCLRRGAYARIDPDARGRLLSEALGLELRAEGKLVRFLDPKTGERLRTLDEAEAGRLAAERERRKAQRQQRKAERIAEEQQARIAELEAQLKALREAP